MEYCNKSEKVKYLARLDVREMKSFQDKSLVLNFTPIFVPAAGMTIVLHVVPSTTRL